MNAHRSGCPINLTLETLGDRWSLIVVRDLMFGNRRHFRELLTRSEEGIASNVLADRLRRLESARLISRRDDPSHKQKAIYSLSEAAIELVPLLAQMGAWGRRHTRASKELSVRAQILEEGGPKLWSKFMDELRHLHLGGRDPRFPFLISCSPPSCDGGSGIISLKQCGLESSALFDFPGGFMSAFSPPWRLRASRSIQDCDRLRISCASPGFGSDVRICKLRPAGLGPQKKTVRTITIPDGIFSIATRDF